MDVKSECKGCGSEDLQITLDENREAADDSVVKCKDCGKEWSFAEHKENIAKSAKEALQKMLGNFKL